MELYIVPEPINRNPLTGRFNKGSVPFNKGKRWEDYIDTNKIPQLKANIPHTGRKNLWVSNQKPVVGIKDGQFFGVFDSATVAAQKLGLDKRNIGGCCHGRRKRCGGIEWYFEKEIDKWIHRLKSK